MGGWQTSYRRNVAPRLLNCCLGMRTPTQLRRTVCAGLAGDVVEIGFGSGLNVPHYPKTVASVAAVEPADVAWQLASRRVAASGVPIRHAGIDGQKVSFDDDTFDMALSTWTWCSIPDAPTALAELRRVLRPGGRYLFLEHGLAPDVRVQRMQHRVRATHHAVFGGCDLIKPVLALIEGAGFELDGVRSFYQRRAPKYVGADSLGAAVNPGT